ncbi:MAG: hypothetical protein POH28_14595 [Acidocella sp.]|nr:hypothetical protein [Acidocella sp.]
MRTILMASSALMLMSGIALAQTAGTAAPVPAQSGMKDSTANGQMQTTSPSSTAPAPVAAQSGMKDSTAGGQTKTMSANTSTHGTMGHSTTGTQTMPKQRQSTMSKTMGHSGTMMHHTAMMHHTMMHDGMMHHGMMANGTAGQYMHMAQQAVMAHNKMRATEALGRAETDLLTNSYTQGSVTGPISTPAIAAIRDARKDVRSGDYHGASMMIHKAMMGMHAGMANQGSMSNGTMSNGTMSNTGMSNSTMSNGAMGTNTQKGPGSMQGKKDSTMHNQMTKSAM